MATGEIPVGWSYNPASWSQRLPIVILATIGFLIASYLALYQLRIIPSVWEPFFGGGSVTILNSRVSHILPIPDAALGAFGYLLDAVTGVIGGRKRWRTMPWIVILFGLAVGPLGAVSVLLVILQPVLFDAWCTLCLTSAAVSLVMIGPAMDEMLASLQYLKRAHDADLSLWGTFWGTTEPFAPAFQDEPEPPLGEPSRAPIWAPSLSCLLGLWLMLTPSALDTGEAARNTLLIVGPLVVSFSIIALWDLTRSLRWMNVPLGLGLLLAPWPLGFEPASTINSLLVGALLLILVRFRGRIVDRVDGGWSMLLGDRDFTPAGTGQAR